MHINNSEKLFTEIMMEQTIPVAVKEQKGINAKEPVRKLLVIDTSYSLEAIVNRGLQESVTCRDLNGYFQHVWTVHPFATLVTSSAWAKKYGRLETHVINERHTFIEGKIGRYAFLKGIFPLNFLIGQIGVFFRLRRLIKKEKINVIRSGDMLYLGLLSWALARTSRIPFLVRVGGNHDKIFETTGQPIQKRLFLNRKIEKVVERFVFKRADLVAGANLDNLNFALSNGARPEFSTIFRYGNLIHKVHFTDPKTRTGGYSILEKLGVEPKNYIIYIGRLEAVKHPDDVVKVLADVRERGQNIKALLVGDGKLLPQLKSLAADLGIADHVIFCGNQNQEWLSNVIPLAAVVVSPHTGRALSEAALGAVPVVAYDVDWQGELIHSGVTGELVPHLAKTKMADAVERFLIDKEYATKMGEAVRQKTMEMMWPDTLDQHERDQYTILLKRFGNK